MLPVNPALVPQRRLNNGMVIPGIGMGTFGNDRFSSEEVSAAVKGALLGGYRLFDCASAYGNEPEIGAALAAGMRASSRARCSCGSPQWTGGISGTTRTRRMNR